LAARPSINSRGGFESRPAKPVIIGRSDPVQGSRLLSTVILVAEIAGAPPPSQHRPHATRIPRSVACRATSSAGHVFADAWLARNQEQPAAPGDRVVETR